MAEFTFANKYEDVGQKFGVLLATAAFKLRQFFAATLQASFTSPSTPRCSQKTSMPIRMPLHMHIVNQPVEASSHATNTLPPLSLTLGGHVTLPECLSSSVDVRTEHLKVTSVYYIVYHGKGGVQGLFSSWDDMLDGPGARGLMQDYEHHLYKKFSDYTEAQMFYESGMLDLLKLDPVSTEVLIVMKGIQPGVYSKW